MNPPISNPTPDPNFVPLAAPAPLQGDGTGGVIPFKNPNALTSYYIGLFSMLPIAGLVMGPAAVVLGIKGLKYAKEHPIVKGQVHAWVGILCGAFWSLCNYGLTLTILLSFLLQPRH